MTARWLANRWCGKSKIVLVIRRIVLTPPGSPALRFATRVRAGGFTQVLLQELVILGRFL